MPSTCSQDALSASQIRLNADSFTLALGDFGAGPARVQDAQKTKREASRLAPALPAGSRTLGYPPILLHHLRRRLILMYCLFTWDRLEATSSGRARNGLSAGSALLLAPAVLLLLLLSAAWLLDAGFSSTELGKEGASLLSSLGEPDLDAAALKLEPGGNCRLALLLMLQACLTPVKHTIRCTQTDTRAIRCGGRPVKGGRPPSPGYCCVTGGAGKTFPPGAGRGLKGSGMCPRTG